MLMINKNYWGKYLGILLNLLKIFENKVKHNLWKYYLLLFKNIENIEFVKDIISVYKIYTS